MTWRILLVDADDERRDVLERALAQEAFEVDVVAGDREAVECFAKEGHDLVMVGANIPAHGGAGLCRTLRIRSDVPIILVTSGNDEAEVVAAFEGGADDCITQPHRAREVVARVRAAIRRVRREPVAAGFPGPYRSGRPIAEDVFDIEGIRLDAACFEVTVHGQRVEFPLKEFEVLALLLANAGRTLTRRTLIDRVWGTEPSSGSKTLDAHIRRIRAKIEDEPSAPTRIVTIRGLGYRYNR